MSRRETEAVFILIGVSASSVDRAEPMETSGIYAGGRRKSNLIILFPKIALLALPSKFPVLISIPFAGPIYASCPTPNER
jgi:hypothetical protein